MKEKYEGVAFIELEDVETGKKETYEEHNELTCLLDDIFADSQYDGYLNYDATMNKYFNTLVCYDNSLGTGKDVVDDNINIVGKKTVDAAGTKYGNNGIEYVFKFGTEEANGLINCLSLAPTCFQDPTIDVYKNSNYVSGDYKSFINGQPDPKIIKIDVEKNLMYALELPKYSDYKRNQPFYVSINKYYHSFNTIPLTASEDANFKLLEQTEIDIQYMLSDAYSLGSGAWLGYGVDEDADKIIIFRYSPNGKIFNTAVFSPDNTTDIVFYNMTIPSYITLNYAYNSDYRIQTMPVYHNQLCFFAKVDDDGDEFEEEIGLDYTNTTNITEYETVFITGTRTGNEVNNEQLLNLNNGTCISKYMMIKNDVAYLTTSNTQLDYGYFYKSKIIKITRGYNWFNPSGYYLGFSYSFCNYCYATRNELSKALSKTNKQTMKITYRISPKEG